MAPGANVDVMVLVDNQSFVVWVGQAEDSNSSPSIVKFVNTVNSEMCFFQVQN